MIEILALCILGGYILGSVPYGLVLTRMAGIDLRKVGPGTIGATNVLRTGKKGLALLTLILDAGKAGLAAWLAYKFAPESYKLLAELSAGTAAVVGHNFPVWLKFKGGKGVASTFGFLLVVAPFVALLALATWLIMAVVFRYSSLAAITAAILTPVFAYFYENRLTGTFFIGIAILVIIRHHTNIKRLLGGTESKIKLKKGS